MKLDEMKELRNMFGEKPTVKLRERARPTIHLANNGKTCKTCVHAVARHFGGTYHKCRLNEGRWTQGSATDIRLKDPACARYEEKL